MRSHAPIQDITALLVALKAQVSVSGEKESWKNKMNKAIDELIAVESDESKKTKTTVEFVKEVYRLANDLDALTKSAKLTSSEILAFTQFKKARQGQVKLLAITDFAQYQSMAGQFEVSSPLFTGLQARATTLIGSDVISDKNMKDINKEAEAEHKQFKKLVASFQEVAKSGKLDTSVIDQYYQSLLSVLTKLSKVKTATELKSYIQTMVDNINLCLGILKPEAEEYRKIKAIRAQTQALFAVQGPAAGSTKSTVVSTVGATKPSGKK